MKLKNTDIKFLEPKVNKQTKKSLVTIPNNTFQTFLPQIALIGLGPFFLQTENFENKTIQQFVCISFIVENSDKEFDENLGREPRTEIVSLLLPSFEQVRISVLQSQPEVKIGKTELVISNDIKKHTYSKITERKWKKVFPTDNPWEVSLQNVLEGRNP